MNGDEAETQLPNVDLKALEAWLEGLPKAAERRKHAQLAGRAADQLEALQKRLEATTERLQAVQAGLAVLAEPKLGRDRVLEDLLDGLNQLPAIEMRALASFAEGHGRTLPNQAERFSAGINDHWRGLCERRARDAEKPLRVLHGAMERAPGKNRAKQDAIKFIITRIKAAKEKMIDAPESANSFVTQQKAAQDHLARTLSGVSNPSRFVEQLGDGGLRLGALSTSDLEALLRSPLADAITLKL